MNCGACRDCAKGLQAEVEQLRAKNADLIARMDRYYEDGHRAATEEMQERTGAAEAEVERLRADFEEQNAITEREQREVERLRADQDGIDAELRAARAEVERLRKSEAAAWRQYANMAENSQEYADEVERLRGEIQDMANEHNGGWVPRVLHDEEVERLRKLYNKAQDDASKETERRVHYQAEAERLRAALEDALYGRPVEARDDFLRARGLR